MQRIEAQHVFDCDTATYWTLFWDPDYDAILRSKANYEREFLDDHTEGSVRTWRARVTPERELPSMVKKLLGADKLIYEQHNRLDMDAGVLEWRVVPAVLSDKIDCHGVMKVLPAGPRRCRREVDGKIEVKVFGVGGRIEKVIVDNVLASYDSAAEAIREYLGRDA